MTSVADALVAAVWATGLQLAYVLGPAAACAVVLAQLQRMLAATLTNTFGWRAMLVTGWLGVPVHELSHFVACVLFMHEVDEVKLFAPDPETGTLGVVRHHAPRGNPWAAIGRLFIAVAPLAGGALALLLAAHLLLPRAAFDLAGTLDGAAAGPRGAFEAAWEASAALLDPTHLRDPRGWLFLYVVTCVGAHLAPSASDLGGAARGALALVASLLVANLIAGAFGGFDAAQLRWVAALTTPVVALLAVAVVLTALALALALIVTAVVERLRGGRGHLVRFVGTHWLRLAVGGAAAGAFAAAAAT